MRRSRNAVIIISRALSLCISTALILSGLAPAVLATPQDDKAALQSEINSVNSQLSDVIARYDAATNELSQTEEAIARGNEKLEASRRNLSAAREALNTRARGIYKHDGIDVLEVIFGSKSINEFTECFDLLSMIGNADAELVQGIITDQRTIELTMKDLEAARSRQAELFDQVAADKASIEKSVQTKLSRLSELESQIALEEQGRRGRGAPSIWHGTLPPASSGVVAIAYALIGVRYTYGGNSPDEGFDCSGFVGYCYAQIGISLNRTADYPPNLSWAELEPGDLVYTHGGGHVGIYVGGGRQIHAPYSGTVVQVGPINSFCGGYRP
ncbi:MAG: NlpC/P60 family protein [Actinomycetota bacterium]